jgi:antitoxin component of MazEF toxin-antitoxin module
MHLRIAKWGNGLVVRIPAGYARRVGLKDGDMVFASLTVDGALTIRAGRLDRKAFAAELAQARQGMRMGSSVIEELRNQARY